MASVEGRVAHVWRRLGFGPQPGDVAAGVAAGGPSAVIDDLLSRQPDPIAPAWPTGDTWETFSATINRLVQLMVVSPAQVQERVSWILQGLLVVATTDEVGVDEHQAHVDTLRRWPSTSYRNLLEQVTRSPGMQWYLSGVRSTPPHPNENLARELLELFSLGVTHPKSGAQNYTEADVKEIARALTGFWYSWDGRPVHFDPAHWDSGSKTFLGAARGAAGVTEVLNAVAGHSSFRYFVPRRLYRDSSGSSPATPCWTAWPRPGAARATWRPSWRRSPADPSSLPTPPSAPGSRVRWSCWSRPCGSSGSTSHTPTGC